MGDTSKSASISPWPWIIETLAGFKEVDNSTLHDLIDVSPAVPNDLSKNTTELIAMRCLEGLFGSAHRINSDSCSLNSRVGLDFSRSSEDVLQQILHDIPLSDLEIAEAKLCKWDTCPFIMHKRAATYKGVLEQLKESIIEGTHPCTELLRARSGLALQNRDCQVPFNDGKCNDLTEKDNENCSYDKIVGAKENASSKEHLLDAKFSSSKRNRDYSADEHVVRFPHGKQVGKDECDDFLRNAKKSKCHAPSDLDSKKDKGVYPHEVFAGDASTTMMPEHTLGDEHFQNTTLHDTKDDNEHCIEPVPMNIDDPDKILCKSTKSQSELAVGLLLKEPNATYPNGSKKLVVSDEGGVDTVNGCGAEHNDLNDFAAQEHELLSSQYTSTHDFSKQNLCMKCNEGGELLACRTTTCQLKIHESCLGTSARFDANGNFFCPFCAYSHAVSEYFEAKKKASLARKDLRIFLGRANEHQGIERSEIQRKEGSLSIKRKCEHIHVKDNGDHHFPGIGREDKPEEHVIEQLNEINSYQSDRIEQGAESPTLCDNILPSCQEKGTVNNRLDKVLVGEEEMGGIANPKSSAVRGLEENHVPVDQVAVNDRCFRQEVNLTSVNPNNTEDNTRQEMLEQHDTNQTEEPVSAHGNEEDNISQDGSEKARRSRYSTRPQKCGTLKVPAITFPHLRRRKIPWTAEEEEILTEGVRRFGASDQKIPWKEILEFGSSVFLKDRTTVDLKDKWRNICKARSKLN